MKSALCAVGKMIQRNQLMPHSQGAPIEAAWMRLVSIGRQRELRCIKSKLSLRTGNNGNTGNGGAAANAVGVAREQVVVDLMHKDNCRVCGYEFAYFPWGDEGEDPPWDICPCCGTEFGYEDCTPVSTKEKRAQWIAAGCPWFDRKKKPLDWDLKHQCEKIPEAFK